MFFKWGFKSFPISKKIQYLKAHGIMLGSRMRNERQVFLYMVKDFFVEVVYHNDNLEMNPEIISTFSNLETLNSYLEREFRAAF